MHEGLGNCSNRNRAENSKGELHRGRGKAPESPKTEPPGAVKQRALPGRWRWEWRGGVKLFTDVAESRRTSVCAIQ